KLCVKLRLVHLDDVDEHLAVGALAELSLELLNFRTLAPDHNARTGGANQEAQLVAWTLDFHRAHAGSLQLVAQLSLELHVFYQELVVVTLAEPARTPRFVHSQPESIRMDFLSHAFFLKLQAYLPAFFFATGFLAGAFFAVFAAVFAAFLAGFAA